MSLQYQKKFEVIKMRIWGSRTPWDYEELLGGHPETQEVKY